MARRVRSLRAAAAWVEDAGLAVVYSSADLVLPSLWEAVGGPDANWAIRDEEGKAVDFTPEFSKLWRWKDELPEQRLACSGRHLGRGAASVVARRFLPALYALTGRSGQVEDFRDAELDPLEREIAEAVLENGPCSGPEVRRLVAGEKRKVDAAIGRLHRELILTNAGIVERDQGWPAIRNDVFARRWRPASSGSPSRTSRDGSWPSRCCATQASCPSPTWRASSAGAGRRPPRPSTA